MAAVFQFSESNTAIETITDGISNLNFGSNDSANLNVSTYPVTRGNASYEKYLRAKYTGVYTEISNMKFWRSDILGYVTGETLKAAANVAFATPSQTPNADSDIPLNVGASLSLQSAEGAATIVYGGSGVSGYTKYIRMQLRTTGSTPSGSVYQKILTLQYDEV